MLFKIAKIDNTLPYLLYTNARTIEHNKYVFKRKPSETFVFMS